MGRKNLKAEKLEIILDAFELCVETNGIQGTTLENVAAEAKMARRMVRHYVGNRDDLVEAGIARIIEKFILTALGVINKSAPESRMKSGLDYLFSADFNNHPATKTVAALLPASFYDPLIKKAVKTIYDNFQLILVNELKLFNPSTDEDVRSQTAYTLMCLSFGSGWMLNLGFDERLNRQNKVIAEKLINNL